MKRFYTTLCTVLICLSTAQLVDAQFSTDWQLSVATANIPSWLTVDNNDRGFAYLNGKIYIAEGSSVRELNASDGSEVGTINVTGISTGDRAISDMEVSDDGFLFACNLRVNTVSGPFRVYMWSDIAGAPSSVMDYTHVGSPTPRLGDKCTVTGSYSDGTAEIWAASATTGDGRVFVFRMVDGSFSTTPSVITLSDAVTGGSAQASPLPDGSFYFNATGIGIKKYSASGTLLGSVSTGIVASGSNAVKYITTIAGSDYVTTHQFGANNENSRVVIVPTSNFAGATIFGTTPTNRGAVGNANGNGVGDTAFRVNSDGSFTIYALGTNNGVSSSTTTSTAFTYNYVATIRGNAGWRMMSAPFNNMSTTVFSGKAGIQGFANDGFTRNFYTGHNGTTWTPLASDPSAAQPTTLAAGSGFLLYLFDNANVGSSPIGSGMKIVANGLQPTTDVTVSVHADGTDKINLLGNPFNQAINVSSITADGDFLSTVLVWSDADNDWLLSSDLLTLKGKIAPWQGFILGNTNATEITIPLSAKSIGGEFFKTPSETLAQLQFRLYTRDGDHATLRDRSAIVQFRQDAVDGWDSHDFAKLASLNPQSAMMYFLGDRDGSIVAKTQESRPYDFTTRTEIPFDVISYGLGSDMRIDWPVLHQLPDGVEITLYDRLEDTEISVKPGRSYDFSLDASMRAKSANSGFGGRVEIAANEPRFTLIVDPSQTTSTKDDGRGTMDEFALLQNYPNPFNPSTQIRFTLQSSNVTRLTVYDVVGREVAVLVNGVMSAGAHSVSFDASNLSSGVYLYKLEAGGQVLTKRMTLMK